VKVIVLGVLVAAMAKLQQSVISKSDEAHHQGRAAIQQLSAPVTTRKFVLMTYYDVSTTSRLAKNI